jgi:hypothetical protein
VCGEGGDGEREGGSMKGGGASVWSGRTMRGRRRRRVKGRRQQVRIVVEGLGVAGRVGVRGGGARRGVAVVCAGRSGRVPLVERGWGVSSWIRRPVGGGRRKERRKRGDGPSHQFLMEYPADHDSSM